VARCAGPVAALSEAELAALAENALVDAYGEDEQAAGFHAVIMDNVKMPFMCSLRSPRLSLPMLAGSVLAVSPGNHCYCMVHAQWVPTLLMCASGPAQTIFGC
jgi:calcium binding protein